MRCQNKMLLLAAADICTATVSGTGVYVVERAESRKVEADERGGGTKEGLLGPSDQTKCCDERLGDVLTLSACGLSLFLCRR